MAKEARREFVEAIANFVDNELLNLKPEDDFQVMRCIAGDNAGRTLEYFLSVRPDGGGEPELMRVTVAPWDPEGQA